MHGLVNRSIQCFVEDTYGGSSWDHIIREARLEFRDFEAMLAYNDAITEAVLDAAAGHLGRDRNTLLEDLGTYLVTHSHMNSVRRLLRFGGHTFEDFLQSLDDLHDRVKLAMPDLELPHLELTEVAVDRFSLVCRFERPGYGAVLQGILRALADDYGALVLLDLEPGDGAVAPCEVLHIQLLEKAFARGRSFSLAGHATG
ncbi:MAG: heme NO-binding domain-containing protein [Litoreibacter sp.]|nr:heme NO-binding domain-containing protein [Litoreibacter sp.]